MRKRACDGQAVEVLYPSGWAARSIALDVVTDDAVGSQIY